MQARRLRLLAVVLALAGCSGGDETLPREALPRLVLAPADLPAPFERFDEGRQGIFESPAGRRGDPERFGRIGGWKARFRRQGSAETAGPLVVASRAELFDAAGGAEQELELIRGDEPGARSTDAVGDDAIVATETQAGVPRRVVNILVAWRSGEVVGTLELNGFEGRLREADALRLARRQQGRIDAARG